MQKTSQGSVEPEKEHCWQIWYSIFWQIRPSCSVRNTLCLVQFGGRPYKSDRCGHNSEWKKILTSSPGSLTYGVIDLGVFLPLVIHLPSEKSILPKFSSLRGVAILGWESLSQAGSARVTPNQTLFLKKKRFCKDTQNMFYTWSYPPMSLQKLLMWCNVLVWVPRWYQNLAYFGQM